jgi:5'-3' exonuclease
VPEDEPLLIADVPWLLYRSFFALPKSIVDERGRPVNALLGTVNALLAMFETRLAARGLRGVVACTGAEQASYRVALYPAYHAQRAPMPDALRAQWEKAPGLLGSLGWTVADSAELEADDVMFSFARCEAEAGGKALLMTADRDLYAAVDERVSVVELARRSQARRIGPAQVRERYGVEPALVADFIALRGDASDGLPGAPGIGAKTAAALLGAYGSLEGVLDAALRAHARARARTRAKTAVTPPDDIRLRPRTAAVLCENAELLRTFKAVATLQRIDVRRARDTTTDFAGGARAARELGMRGLAGRLGQLARART